MAAPVQTDSMRAELLATARDRAWFTLPWGDILPRGVKYVAGFAARAMTSEHGQYADPATRTAMGGGQRSDLVVLSDPRLWGLQSFLAGTEPIAGAPRFQSLHDLPRMADLAAILDAHPELMDQLRAHYGATPSAIEDLVLTSMTRMRNDKDRVASSITWEMSLFSRPMLDRIHSRGVFLLAHGGREVDEDGTTFVSYPRASFTMDWHGIRAQAPVDVGFGPNAEIDAAHVTLAVDELRHELKVRDELVHRGHTARSDVLSHVERELGRRGAGEGAQLTRTIGPFISGAMSYITPVRTNAQRLADIQAMADGAAVGNPANAPRALVQVASALDDLLASLADKRPN